METDRTSVFRWNLQSVLDAWVLERIDARDVTRAATDWLVAGHESPAILHLAGLIGELRKADVEPLVVALATEWGLELPLDPEAATCRRCDSYCRMIVDAPGDDAGNLDRARGIWFEASDVYDAIPAYWELTASFVNDVTDWDDSFEGQFFEADSPEAVRRRSSCIRSIVDHASTVIAAGGYLAIYEARRAR